MIRRRYHNGKKVKPLNAGFCKFWQHHQDWLEYLPSLEHAEWLGLCRQIMPAVRTHSVFLPGSEHTEWLGLCRQTMPAVRTHSVFFITRFWTYGMTQAMPADNAGGPESFRFFYYPVLGLRNDSGYAGGQCRKRESFRFLLPCSGLAEWLRLCRRTKPAVRNHSFFNQHWNHTRLFHLWVCKRCP